MIEYIKTMAIGILAGATVTQLLNIAVQECMGRPFTIGGEFLIPALVGLIGYIGWMTASEYFSTFKYKEIYQRGYLDGLRINKYKVVIPVEYDLKKENEESHSE